MAKSSNAAGKRLIENSFRVRTIFGPPWDRQNCTTFNCILYKNRANLAFRRGAQSLARSQTALGSFYRRIRAKHGGPKAVVATAHKLARIVYFMLKRREPYRDPGADYYDQQHQARVIRSLSHRAATLGFRLEPLALDQVS